MRFSRFILPPMVALALAAVPRDDEQAIRGVVQSYLASRDNDDAQALGDLFVPGADQLVSSGEWRTGRDAVVQGTLRTSKRTGGKRAITLVKVRFIAPDAAVADGHYELTGLAGSQTRHMWTTFVLVRVAAGWRIAAIRNMLPAQAAPGR
jgi:uncharacterized protein (TIGR02246 family)